MMNSGYFGKTLRLFVVGGVGFHHVHDGDGFGTMRFPNG